MSVTDPIEQVFVAALQLDPTGDRRTRATL
jgi:hypothetical protein